MKTKVKPKASATIVAFFLAVFAVAQSGYDGDALSAYLGKELKSQEVQGLITNYKCEISNPTHCASKDGLELVMKKEMVDEIHLYKSSPVYGSFTGKLPKGLKFGMSSGEIRGILGKPAVSYSNGYSEFELSNCGISCWFESGKLSQITISMRSSAL